MKRILVAALIVSFAAPSFAKSNRKSRRYKRSTSSTSTAKVSTSRISKDINNSWQIEIGQDSMTSSSTATVDQSQNAGALIQNETRGIGKDDSNKVMRISARKNFSLGNNFFASLGTSLKQQETKTGSTQIITDNSNFNNDFVMNSKLQIKELLVEQRVGHLFNLSLMGFAFGLRPFTGISAGFRETTQEYQGFGSFAGVSSTVQAKTTQFVLIPTLGTDIIFTNNISATLSLSQTSLNTKGSRLRDPNDTSNNIDISSTSSSASILSLGVAYHF